MSPDTDPEPAPDIQFQQLRGSLDAAAAHDFDAVYVGDDMNDLGEPDDGGEAEETADAEESQEPFIPLGSEDPPEGVDAPYSESLGVHTAIARSLHAPPSIPRALRKEARAFFDGAMYAYTEGDLPGARLTFLAVAGIGDPDTAPAAMVFLGVIAYRHRDVAEARMWFSRAAAGADEHWARVAAEELRRLG
jgi:hypothetical protein